MEWLKWCLYAYHAELIGVIVIWLIYCYFKQGGFVIG